jgi:hypothetical protein
MKTRSVIILLGAAAFLSFPLASGAQWIQAGDPGGGWITSLVLSGTNLYAGTRQGGVFLSKDKGASWIGVNSGLPAKTDVQFLAVSGSILFAGTVGHGVYRSTNNGGWWAAVNSGLPEGCSAWRLAVSGTNLFAVAGVKRITVYLSTDNGETWALANKGLPDTTILCLAASGTSLYAGAGQPFSNRTGGVFLSNDNGATWVPINKGFPPKREILCLAVDGPNLFAGTWAMGLVFKSTNNGGTWSDACSGLPDPLDFSLSCLALIGKTLYLGSFKGVFKLEDNSESWTAINNGLAAGNSVYCFAFSGQDLFAGTEQGRVWRLPLSEESQEKQQSADVAHAKAGRAGVTIAEAKKAVKLNPEDAEAWYALGSCYEKAGRKKDADKAFERAKKLKPELFKK